MLSEILVQIFKLLQQKVTIINDCDGSKKLLCSKRTTTAEHKEQLLTSTRWKLTEDLTPFQKFGPPLKLLLEQELVLGLIRRKLGLRIDSLAV